MPDMLFNSSFISSGLNAGLYLQASGLILATVMALTACSGSDPSAPPVQVVSDDPSTPAPAPSPSPSPAPGGDTTKPTVSITSPAAGAVVSGTRSLTALASDNVGLTGVQFRVNGVNTGAEDTSSPYTISYDTTQVPDGSYTLTAVARDAAGNTATSAAITLTVSNKAPAPADTSAPTVPSGVTATAASSFQINLAWNASTDNVGVTGYKVYRNGAEIGATTQRVYAATGLAAKTSYTFQFSAFDAAGNASARSASVTATTFSATAGTSLSDLATRLKPGEWGELSTSGFSQGEIMTPSGGVGQILQYTDEAQWDPINRRLYVIGCARGVGSDYTCNTSDAEDAKWVMYSEATNSWQKMTATTPFSLRYHSYDQAAVDPQTGDYYYMQYDAEGEEVWRFRSGSWSKLPPLPTSRSCCGTGAIEFFPELGGLVVVDHGGQFFVYKPSTNSWSTIAGGGMPFGEYHNITEYSKARQLLYVAGGVNAGRVLLMLDKQGKLTRAADAPVNLGISSKGAVHTVDPVSGNLIVLTWDSASMYEYNPDGNSWRQVGSHPVKSQYDTLTVAAPLPEYGVIMFVMYDEAESRVYLYKHSGS
jgi:hypothetical protein